MEAWIVVLFLSTCIVSLEVVDVSKSIRAGEPLFTDEIEASNRHLYTSLPITHVPQPARLKPPSAARTHLDRFFVPQLARLKPPSAAHTHLDRSKPVVGNRSISCSRQDSPSFLSKLAALLDPVSINIISSGMLYKENTANPWSYYGIFLKSTTTLYREITMPTF